MRGRMCVFTPCNTLVYSFVRSVVPPCDSSTLTAVQNRLYKLSMIHSIIKLPGKFLIMSIKMDREA